MEENIQNLHEKLEEYMLKNIFSNNLQKKFHFEFERLQQFMKFYSLGIYNKDVGAQYIKFRSISGNSRYKEGTKYRIYIRYIELLDGLLEQKWIIKKSKKNYSSRFSGNVGSYIFDFLLEYSKTRFLSVPTTKNYYSSLQKFCDFLQSENVNNVADIKSDTILGFMSALQHRKDHAAIILRGLLAKLYEEKIINFSTANTLHKFNIAKLKKLPSYYYPHEVIDLENSIDRKYNVGKRDYAMVLLATRLGLRSSDIRFLQFSNIDWDKNKILLEQFKTKNRIELPLITDVGESIIDYIKHARPNSNSKFIFLRASSPYQPMTAGGLTAVLNKYFRNLTFSAIIEVTVFIQCVIVLRPICCTAELLYR